MVLIDIGLPDGNGFEVGQYIKEYRKQLPIIFLTANDEEKDVVYGLDLGADDYIIKPFRNRELISRIKNTLRRNGKPDMISCKGISIDTVQRKVFKEGMEVDLTKLEYRICLNLFSNINKLITREELLNDIWDMAGNFVNDSTLTVYIKRIREEIVELLRLSNKKYNQTIVMITHDLEIAKTVDRIIRIEDGRIIKG